MKYKQTKLSGMAGVLLAATSAQGAIWVGLGSDNEFSTIDNWAVSATDPTPVAPASGSTQDINGAFTVERSVNSTAGRTFVAGGAVLNITGGTHNDNQSGNSTRNFVGRGSQGTVNVSGGSYNVGHIISIGGGGTNGNGVFSVTGGSAVISRGSNGANLATGTVGGYSLEVGGNAGGAGLFEISGGSLATRIGVGIGQTGTFSVVGSGATSIGIGSNGSLDGEWNQFSGGTLSGTIDLGGITPIFIDDVNGGGVSALFQSGSLLDLAFASGVTPFAGSWTLLEAEGSGITDSGLGLASGVDSGWSFAVDNSGTNGLLIATYTIPEPSTSLLAGSALLLGLGFRRRKA